MVVEPKVRGFICTTAHPVGCKQNVLNQINYVKGQPKTKGPKKVLVIGASAGYGLASRIVSTYSCGAGTIGVIFDKEAGSRPASAGWYNTAAFEEFAEKDGYYAKTINGDAFSGEIKKQTIELIKKDFGKVDCVVYSLASPRRTTADGITYSSVLKTTDASYTNKTIDLKNNMVSEVTIEPATQEEIDHTVKVMGGEDWMDWMDALKAADAIEDHAVTMAYSYIGPEVTHPMYLNGSIGMAKRHLYNTANEITEKYKANGIKGYISVNKALVTQSSAAIPIVPLYISILYKIMKEKGNHEGCIEQIYRLYHDKLCGDTIITDTEGRLRPDDREMEESIQIAVMESWNNINTDNVSEYADLDGYWLDFYQMFGFKIPEVDYSQDVEINVKIPSIQD